MNAHKRYRCPQCEELHDDKMSAEDCCTPGIDEFWMCGICDLVHDTRDEAEVCCLEDRAALEALRPSADELESAGQMRLVP